MLKIWLGANYAEEHLAKKNFIRHPNERFDRVKKPEWFQDAIIKEIISEIDDSDVAVEEALIDHSSKRGYNVVGISVESKSLILMYKFPEKVVLSKVEDSHSDLIERVSSELEKHNQDLTIAVNRAIKFNFKYTKEVHFINFDITCKNKNDIENLITPLWNNSLVHNEYNEKAIGFKLLNEEITRDGKEVPLLDIETHYKISMIRQRSYRENTVKLSNILSGIRESDCWHIECDLKVLVPDTLEDILGYNNRLIFMDAIDIDYIFRYHKEDILHTNNYFVILDTDYMDYIDTGKNAVLNAVGDKDSVGGYNLLKVRETVTK